MRRYFNARTIINFISFLSLCLIAIAITCVEVFKAGKFTSALHLISECLAYFVVILTSFGFARSKRSFVWLALWFMFSALLVVMVVLVN